MHQHFWKSAFTVWSGLLLTVGLAIGLTLLALASTVLAYQQQDRMSVKKLSDQVALTGTAFIYQGQLNENGLPAKGIYDFRFTLYAARNGHDELDIIASEAVVLTNGLFALEVDFGRAVNDLWLEMAVRRSDSADAYVVLSPRQKLTPMPYAIFARQGMWSFVGMPIGVADNVDDNTGMVDPAATEGKISSARKDESSPGTSVAAYPGGGLLLPGNGLYEVESPPRTYTWHVGGGSGISVAADTVSIATGGVATAMLADGAVTRGKLASNLAWFCSGNAGAGPADFLGTTDSRPLMLRTNNTERLRITETGNIGIGTTTPLAKFHLLSSDNPTVMRIHSAGAFGAGRIEFWSDPQGSTNMWRPGFIQSTDNGNFTGGLAFYVNGTGGANRTGQLEVMRIVNGNVGIGTTTPGGRLHVLSDTSAAGETGLVLVIPGVGARRVVVGPANSGGAGFRYLRVLN